jgi:hypothetical protein
MIALPLKRAFPRVTMLKLRLVFNDGSELPPAAQTHSLHPPAQAFFRFPCPFSDCDGEFDLTPVVEGMAKSLARDELRSLECQGVRVRDRATGHLCGLKLECSIQMDSETVGKTATS